MSYPLDLDEMKTSHLVAELEQRRRDRADNRCDYCHRPYDEGMCKFPRRHSGDDHA